MAASGRRSSSAKKTTTQGNSASMADRAAADAPPVDPKPQTRSRKRSSSAKQAASQAGTPLRFWLESDITSDEDVERDTFGPARLAKLGGV
jgi:hypothetical protein